MLQWNRDRFISLFLSRRERANVLRCITKSISTTFFELYGRVGILVNEVQAVKPKHDLPKLPVARVLWKLYPDM